jgi:glycosyltransferase involved in cell wall biosynthesis
VASGLESCVNIAVLIPCFDEEAAIPSVVEGFRRHLPDAKVYVYDNNSRDDTAAVARAMGAIVRHESMQGKGHVVRRMFSDVEADVYVLVDGDGTYDSAAAPAMVALLADRQLDMVTGIRTGTATFRHGHRFGNRVLTGLARRLFGDRVTDMLSGYRVLSRRFVKSFPALSGGFETETELTVHALTLNMPIAEFPTIYWDRPAASVSKLRTYRDGWRILRTILILLKEEKPFQVFGITALGLLGLGLALGLPVVATFLKIGLVPRFPTAILATGLELLAFLSFACGLILDSVSRGRKEMKRLAYLALPAVPAASSTLAGAVSADRPPAQLVSA